MGWISLNTQSHVAAGRIKFPTKPLSVTGCSYQQLSDFNFNATSSVHANIGYVVEILKLGN